MTLFDLVAILSLDSSDYEKGLDNAESKGKGFGSKLASGLGNAAKTIAKTTVAAVGAATTATVAFAKNAVSVGRDFDSAISQVAATMGLTMDEMEQQTGSVDLAWGTFSGNLREYAQEMGSRTAFSATQAADALNYMALAGYDVQTSMEMLPNVLNLAAAGGLELATASDMITDAQSALGISLEDTTALVDQMAKASSKSNTSVGQLGEAILTIGGTAQFMSGGTDRLATVLGILADNGIKGSEAGTHLRNMLLKLSSPTKDGAYWIEKLGLQIFDAQGNMRDMQDIVQDLGDAMADMSDEEKVKALSDLFNARDVAAVQALLGTTAERWEELGNAVSTSEVDVAQFKKGLSSLGGNFSKVEQNLKKLGVGAGTFNDILRASYGDSTAVVDAIADVIGETEDYDKIVQALGGDMGAFDKALKAASHSAGEATGAAQKMADTQLDNLAGDITLFKSALEAAQIAVSDKLTPSLRKFVQFGSDSITKLTSAFKEKGLAGALEALGDILSDGLAMIIEKLPEVISAGIALLKAFISGIVDNLDLIVNAGVQIIMSLVRAFTENIGMIVSAVLTIIKSFTQAIIDNLPEILQSAITIINELTRGIIDAIPTLAAAIPQIINTIVDVIFNNLPEIIQIGFDLLQALIDGILSNLPAIIQAIAHIITRLVEFIIENLPEFIKSGIQIVFSLINGIIDMLPEIIGTIVQLIVTIITTIASHLDEIFAEGSDILMEIIDGLIDAIPKLIAAIPQIIKAIIEAFAKTDWLQVGKNIIEGIKNGIVNMATSLANKVKEVAGNALSAIKNFFGIHSPSRVFRDQVGKMLGLGLAEGIEESAENAIDAAENMARSVVDEMDAINTGIPTDFNLTSGMNAENGLTGMNRSVIINVYGAEGQNINDLAEIVSQKIAFGYDREQKVWA